MKTAVSIPDRIFREADLLARKTHKSRSHLYTEALAEYIGRHSAHRVTETLNRVSDSVAEYGKDPFNSAAARRILKDSEW